MPHTSQIDAYLAGVDQLQAAIAGMTAEQLDAAPAEGKWSTRQVICHLADFEPVYLDRITRIIAEDEPSFFSGDPDLFAARLAYAQRDLAEEMQLIGAVRRHLARILRTLPAADFQRRGNHSADGPVTLEKLLRHITAHIPHHLPFIAEKRRLLGC
ncbi:DinB family protein [Lignipirellula cremea]|uniref:Metal-dependent hydrolase YfiT n=1 Tax=Lignipirellula cremea TaxID=2528010 RepID=A0A518DNU8_9BACT|nr:DinB family protein [Lignipirellula cremea]QDU93514.1 Putative metal-dependent hydrolase YfiT [Lignipirellula cremea]